ncbi:MAG: S8 family serine peptidase [Blastocatellia bacterium]
MKRVTVVLSLSCFLASAAGVVHVPVAATQSGVDVRSYIVVLNRDTDPSSAAVDAVQHGAQVHYTYRSALKGFAAHMSEIAASALRERDDVAYIETDAAVSAFTQNVPPGITRVDAPQHPWFHTATDVDIAIIDSGVDATHPDLNYFTGADFTGEGLFDGHGHGTHVAGIAAARDNDIGVVGVAPGARLWAVKVLDSSGSGSFTNVIAGLDYVAQHSNEIEIANMSLGGSGYSQAVRDAIAGCVNRGVVVVVAAGNSSTDVYGGDEIFGTSDDTVPAAFPECLTVSAMADTDGQPGAHGSGTSYAGDDQFASFSNHSMDVVAGDLVSSWGAAIDLAAPGVNILSTYKGGGYATMSGTSMASPHVAGSVALYVAQHGRAFDAAGVYAIRQALVDAAQPQYIWQSGDTADPEYNHEFMVFNGSPWWSPPGPPPPPPPITTPSAPANVSAQRYNQTAIGISWQDTSYNESSFEVQRATQLTGGAWSAFSPLGTAPFNSTGMVDVNAKRSVGYRYRVRAVNRAGASGWSNVASLLKK